ncbi:MAG: RNA polymerase sigma factor [Acidobacteria bacterium]|nr:RNA polymerase sigma factor [Acidobacteriota bacterium]MCG2814537.1 RNA polymerase sigma factor [Candidatus Aminicenantes bacterium]MBU1339681.1 RNA polymerase sigma factor [Acidobacteriota bacterium]MBU1474892.1 RNA polymerase sigma factor [Acidobacteriota bacterium]MBU2438783.1 RNA polymerase sigma factor [Acidobacteriota bacterium]
MEDNAVIQNCLQGDREAYGIIVNRYRNNLLAMARSILGNAEEALDATQEALLQVYTHLDRFDQSRNFRTWLFSITYKRCLDRIRGKKTWRKAMTELQTTGNNPGYYEESFPTFDEDGPVHQALSHLRTKERTALVLRVVADYSSAEIGEILKCSENTVRVHVFNAKRKLKKQLGEIAHV